MTAVLPLDSDNLFPPEALNRRAFAVTTLAAGFALAVHPVSAQTITTPAEGLTAGEVTIPVSDGALPAYRAMPATGGPFPVVMVVQEIFGVHEYIKDVCRRFARLGYLAVAPELSARQGNVAQAEGMEGVRAIMSKVPDTQVMADLDATAAWAKQTGGDGARLGITGFCWGGRITWLYAAHAPALKAGVAWYGRLTTPSNPLQSMVPVDLAGQLKAPVLGLYGGADQGIPVADVDKMKGALAAAGKTSSSIIVYDGAPHGFHADYRPSYRPEIAAKAWDECLAWFKQHGVV